MTPGTRSYAGGVTTPVSTESGPSVVKMTPAAIDALHKLGQSQAGSVARAPGRRLGSGDERDGAWHCRDRLARATGAGDENERDERADDTHG